MKAFYSALAILLLLIATTVLLSAMGETRIEKYRDMMPAEDTPLRGAADALSSLSDTLEKERLLFSLLFSHERCDELKSTVARCAAAARADESAEYAILRAELLGLLDMLERDLRPGILDIL